MPHVRSHLLRPNLQLSQTIKGLAPLAYWPLNETSGTTAFDRSVNVRPGTYNGTGYILRGAPGPDGELYSDFGNGASSHVAFVDDNIWSLDNASGLTLFACIKPDTLDTQQRAIITKGNTAAFEWFFTVNASTAGRIFAGAWTAAGLSIMSAIVTGDPLTLGWQVVVASLPTPATNAAIPMYRNKNTNTTTNQNPGNATYTNNAAAMQIGWRADSPANSYFTGGIANVAVFAGQLSDRSLRMLFDAARNDGWFD